MELPEQLEGARYYEGIGRRKRSSARVRIYPEVKDNPPFIVNGKDVRDYFPRFGDFQVLIGPLEDSEIASSMAVTVLIEGGGITGQRDSVRLGLARALVEYDEELRGVLRDHGHLTRDPRVKERKKPGLKRARKAPTYTKR